MKAEAAVTAAEAVAVTSVCVCMHRQVCVCEAVRVSMRVRVCDKHVLCCLHVDPCGEGGRRGGGTTLGDAGPPCTEYPLVLQGCKVGRRRVLEQKLQAGKHKWASRRERMCNGEQQAAVQQAAAQQAAAQQAAAQQTAAQQIAIGMGSSGARHCKRAAATATWGPDGAPSSAPISNHHPNNTSCQHSDACTSSHTASSPCSSEPAHARW